MSRARPLRVLIVTPLGRFGMGGIDRMMDSVADNLIKRPRDDVHVNFAVTRGKGHILWSPVLLILTISRFLGHIFGAGPDVVHVNLSSHGSSYRKIVLCMVLRFIRLPYILHLHGSEFREFWNCAGARLSVYLQTMFVEASRILVLGYSWKEFIVAKAPSVENKVMILPNATPGLAREDLLRTPDQDARILFLGHIGSRKGVPQLLEALSRLRKHPKWTAIIAGNGDIQRTKAFVEGKELSDLISVPGWVGPEEVSVYLAEANILVLPSFSENLPMSVVEGMANRLAIVTTPVGATPDIIENGVTGILVPVGDVDALSKSIQLLIDDAELRVRLGSEALRYHSEHLEIGKYVERLVGIWKSVA